MLIALGILGLIATFTIPKVMTEMTWVINKAKLKTNISALNQALNTATLDGSYTNVTDALLANLNYAHNCPPNNIAGPCAKAWAWAPPPSGASHVDCHRIIMHDGTIIMFFRKDEVALKVEDKPFNPYPLDGSANGMALRYNGTDQTMPAWHIYPSIAPLHFGPATYSILLYKKVFE
jgi:type II secretory pathway pseudopilin PulG